MVNLVSVLSMAALAAPALAHLDIVAACAKLSLAFPGKVTLPHTSHYPEHNAYWSARQSELTPHCFVSPASTLEVTKALKIIRKLRVPFTVKSGGHVPFPSSNIDTGVVIDLVNLNTLQLSEDKSIVSVGPGNRWKHVASYLDPEGLAVVGGRVGDIGVSGLTLGGGISWFSGKYGWACDNVRRYEVVLADGSVVEASVEENADLYKALRGAGGPNFGIVTRFDFETFEQGNIWYKESLHAPQVASDAIQKFTDLTVEGMDKDQLAHPVMFAAYSPDLNGTAIQLFRWHADPPADIHSVPPSLEDLETLPALSSKNATLSVGDMLNVYPEPPGFRKGWWDTSIRAGDASVLEAVIDNYETWVKENLADKGADVVPVLLMMPLSKSIIAQFQKNGGNSLGVGADTPAQIKINTYITWTNPDQDEFMEKAAMELVEQTEQIAKDRDAFDQGFIYMNNAEPVQDVYERRGADTIALLKFVATKYDPDNVLRTQWKGYFKV